MAKAKTRSISLFSTSFLDVLANTIGGLAFLLVLAMLLIGELVYSPPEITTEELPPGYHDMDYLTWLGAREGMGKYRWTFGAGDHPAGLQLDPNSGKLWGRPQLSSEEGKVNQHKFTVICETVYENDPNKRKEDERSYELTVYREKPVNLLPLRIITDSNLPAAYRGQPYPMTMAAEGGQPPYSWSLEGGSLPAGLSLGREGRFLGSPAQIGEYQFGIVVSTVRGERASERFALTVSEIYPPPRPLRVITDEMTAAVAEREYTFYAAAEGGQPPYRWSAQGNLPAWLNSHAGSTGFRGTPALSDIGKREMRWRVTDSQGLTADSGPMELEVVPPPGLVPPPVQIKTEVLPAGRVARPYSLAVAVEGGMLPYQWSFVHTESLQGLAFQEDTGLIKGTPVSTGTFSVVVEVTDAREQRARADYKLVIHPTLTPVSILTRETQLGRVDTDYSLALSATGGYPPYRWELSEGELPAGLTLDAASGLIAGQPSEPGTYSYAVSVKDAEGSGPAQSQRLKTEILTKQNLPKLTVTTTALPVLIAGQPTEVALACEGGAGPYRWRSRGDLPESVVIEDGRLQGAAQEAGTFDVTLIVTDSAGQEAQADVLLRVRRLVPRWWFLLALATALVALALIIRLVLLVRRYRPADAETESLTILSKSIPNARASCDYSVQLACSGGSAPYHWKVAKGDLPEGLTLEPDGCLHGCPFSKTRVNKTITMTFTVEVRDRTGQTAQQEL